MMARKFDNPANSIPARLRTEDIFQKGLAKHNTADVETAERYYKQALVVTPGHQQTGKYLAKIYHRAGRMHHAFRRILPICGGRGADAASRGIYLSAADAIGHKPNGTRGRKFRPEHFTEAPDRETAKRLFSESIMNIDLELFSYCNRRCLYCPNAFIDRISTNNYLPGNIYQMILRDLVEINFSRKITLNFYNEPLADPITPRTCQELRELLPASFLRLNTNGDYLGKSSLAGMRDAGLNHLMISLHVSKTVDWDDEKVKFRAEQIYDRIGIRPDEVKFIPGRQYHAAIPFDRMRVEVVQGNYSEYGFNIGGLMKHIPAPSERTSPCDEPFRSMTITYNGGLTACCRIRADAPDHQPYVLGNLADYESIFEAWANEHHAAWRKHLVGFNPKAAPCNSCVASCLADTQEERTQREQVEAEAMAVAELLAIEQLFPSPPGHRTRLSPWWRQKSTAFPRPNCDSSTSMARGSSPTLPKSPSGDFMEDYRVFGA